MAHRVIAKPETAIWEPDGMEAIASLKLDNLFMAILNKNATDFTDFTDFKILICGISEIRGVFDFSANEAVRYQPACLGVNQLFRA
jgi:hypothetical protein